MPIVLERTEDDIDILHIEGSLDVPSLPNLRRVFGTLLDHDGSPRVLLDLQQVDFIGSPAIGCLIEFHRDLLSRSGRLALLRVPSKMMQMLELVKLTKVYFSTFESQRNAVEFLMGEP